jgi:hypothetical protein
VKIPTRIFLFLVMIISIYFHLSEFGHDLWVENLDRINIIKNWGWWGEMEVEDGIGLRDGIPDNWEVLTWGNATASFYLEDEITSQSSKVVVIERTNSAGGAAISQRFSIQPGNKVDAFVLAKGDGGALQIQLRDSDQNEWQDGGWKQIGPTTEWSLHKLSVLVPPGMIELRLLLRASPGKIKFDHAYLGLDTEKSLGPNLVTNPDFIQDGSIIDSLVWWKNQNESIPPIKISSVSFEGDIAFQNVVDMSAGNYDQINRRIEELGASCAAIPEATGWLLALGKENGNLQKEQFYRLAIKLAPNCPQPYAALAKLHASDFAFESAASLYHKAYQLSDGTVWAGLYAFEEGFIHIRHTGRVQDAISSLTKASEITGWEVSAWHRGIAPLLLGYAYDANAMPVEANEAFQHVIDCKNCAYHHLEAARRLNAYNLDEK